VDFQKEIATSQLPANIDFHYIKNQTNELFTLYYILDMGKDNSLKLPLAMEFMPYLGTDKYSPEQLKREMFKLGIKLSVHTSNDRCFVYITGLQSSFEKAVELLEHMITNLKPDQKIYDEYVNTIIKKRADAKLDKSNIIWNGMFNYAKYGAKSPFTNIIPEAELKTIKPEELTTYIKEIYSFKHRVLYYGQTDAETVKAIVQKFHKTPSQLKDYPPAIQFAEVNNTKNIVYFVDYDMVQNMLMLEGKDQIFDAQLIPYAQLFNEYFGGSMSSVFFQEIRESKALAYSAYAGYTIPERADKSHYIYAFIATQADKLKTATEASINLLNTMPKAQILFDNSREAIMKRIESERITKADIYWAYQENLDRGIKYDIRKDVYEKMQTANIDELEKYFNTHIKGKKYSFLVLGKKDKTDFKTLKQLGEVKELTLKDVFNY